MASALCTAHPLPYKYKMNLLLVSVVVLLSSGFVLADELGRRVGGSSLRAPPQQQGDDEEDAPSSTSIPVLARAAAFALDGSDGDIRSSKSGTSAKGPIVTESCFTAPSLPVVSDLNIAYGSAISIATGKTETLSLSAYFPGIAPSPGDDLRTIAIMVVSLNSCSGCSV